MSRESLRRTTLVLALLGLAGLAVLVLRRRRGRTPPVTQSMVPKNPADANLGVPGRNAEERLDEALEESFPASDPVSTHIE